MSAPPSEATRPDELDEATIAAWWHDNSAAQGLPDAIDPALIQQVATLALAGDNHGPEATVRHQDKGRGKGGFRQRGRRDVQGPPYPQEPANSEAPPLTRAAPPIP